MRSLLILLVAVGGCEPSSDIPITTDAEADPIFDGAGTVDSSADPDAPACVAHTPVVASIDLDGGTSTPLTLDGIGSRCDQLARAILDPQQRPPELANLDASSAGSPLCVEGAEQDIVRIDVGEVLGKPLLSGGQWLRVFVRRKDTTVVDVEGWILSPPSALPAACASDQELRDAVIGHEQDYVSFSWCAPYGGGTWTLAASDHRELARTGWFYDGAQLRAAREVEVGVDPAHMTQALLDSDLNCCAVLDDAAGCVGLVLIVDADSGKVLGSRPRCNVC